MFPHSHYVHKWRLMPFSGFHVTLPPRVAVATSVSTSVPAWVPPLLRCGCSLASCGQRHLAPVWLPVCLGGRNKVHQFKTNHVTQTVCARHQTVPEGAAPPIVSHSPGPGGNSCGHLPPTAGGDNTRQVDKSQPPRGWAGGQTNTVRHYHNPSSGRRRGWLGVGSTSTISGTPRTRPIQVDGATQPATSTHHAVVTSSPPESQSVPTAPPMGGWVGGQKTA